MTDFLERLTAAFPEHTYSNTLRGLREGVALGDEAIKGVRIFDWPIGRDLRGLMRRAGVLHRLHEMCTAGDLPFVSEVHPMPLGSWHWLEIYSGGIIAHPARTQDSVSFPEDTPNRQDQRARNQYDLFEERKIIPITGDITLYAWLCYGVTRNGAIAHACWNMPSAEKEVWLARINMRNITRGAPASPTQREPVKTDPKKAMSFKDKVLDALEREKREKDEEE